MAAGVLIAALVADAAIGLAHFVNLGGVPILDRSIPLFDLNEERNLPTWWSSVKLFLIAALLVAAAPRLGTSRRGVLFVGLAALVFAFLSLDEFAAIHEHLGRRTRFDALPVTGLWPVIYGIVALGTAAVLTIVARPFFRTDRTALLCLVGGLLAYAALAAGLDLVVNLEAESVALEVLVFIEEMGELLAASVMLYGAARLAIGDETRGWATH